MPIRNKILLILISLLISVGAEATHNRAGEITYKHVSGYTFEFTVTTYTYIKSNANRDILFVTWGDGSSENVPIKNRLTLPNDYYFNTYVARHTFPGPGTYQILMEDPNRNLGVKNIPNSVNTIFSIKTTMLIGPFVGTNSTPILLNPPIDKAARNHIFIHNPGAFDPDGDSLSYILTVCTAEKGNPIEGYILPSSSDTIYIEPYIGDLTWKTPVDTGIYNIAMFIDEWRNGVKIGRITRDMQIDVYNTDNNPPENDPIPDFCVEAGDTIDFIVTSTDPDGDPVNQYMIGAPIFDSSATFEWIEAGAGFSTSRFRWVTNCSYARQQPYTMVLKAEDIVNEISLVDITSFLIRVLPNAPKNLILEPGTDEIKLDWDLSTCGKPIGYRIYRRVGRYNFSADSCENGVPAYTGYELIDEVLGGSTNTYTDDDNGSGLVPGFEYCYMVTAIYSDGVESFASEEQCTSLVPGVPAILEVSVLKDEIATGIISVKWAKPPDFDTIDDGPYRYDVYRAEPNDTNFKLIKSIPSVDLSDTSYVDSNINTLIFPYIYSVEVLYQLDNGNWEVYPGSEIASSLYLDLTGTDNLISIDIRKRAPWFNYGFQLFRKQEAAENFDSLVYVEEPFHPDDQLPNLVPYTYKAHSYGTRPLNNMDYETFNISHINTTSAVDSFPPCPPKPSVLSICDSSYNIISWITPQSLCGDNDVVSYQLYHSPSQHNELQLIETLPPTDTTFIHKDNLETLAAIYGIVAIDSFQNRSTMSLTTIDSCLMYSLPNVFSPGGDGINDIYYSWNLGGFVKKVDMTIFNRYGQEVFHTNNPAIEWYGFYKETGKLVSTGVYYYICEVYEPRLTGEKHRILKGFIHVFSGDSNNKVIE